MPKSPNTPMKWEPAQELAFALVFEGRLTQEAIVDELKKRGDGSSKFTISTRTLKAWIAHPEFQERLAAARADVVQALTEMGTRYVRKEQRIMGLAQMAESARVEYEQRPWLKEVRPTPNGDIVNESFNRDAHAAFRDALNDIAKELGERKATPADADAHTFRLIIETDNDGHTHVSNGAD